MTLPIDKDLLYQRPGDDVFDKIKHHFPYILEQASKVKDLLVKVIVDDMILDHALTEALDDVGKILEYQAQNEEIEKPKFNGLSLLKDAERVGKLNFVINLCKVVGLSDEAAEAVRSAEIDRLWSVEGATKEKKEHSPVLKIPEEVSTLLREISKALGKKGTSNGK